MLVSVIIPTYNRAKTLQRSVQSVLSQTYKNIEIIIIDDNSSDETESVVRSFNDQRIIYIKHDKRMGGAAARNTGIKAAKGELIAFQDSDDEWLVDKLQKQIIVLKNNQYNDVVFSSFIRIKENNEINIVPKSNLFKNNSDLLSILLKRNYIGTVALLLKKKCFDKIGCFDEQLPRFQDWDLVLRLCSVFKVTYLNEPLVIVYASAESISASNISGAVGLNHIVQKHYSLFKKNKSILAHQYFRIGRLYAIAKDFTLARQFFMKAIKTNPFNLIQYLNLLLTANKTAYNLYAKFCFHVFRKV